MNTPDLGLRLMYVRRFGTWW